MESPQLQPAPCPKCGGVRFLADGSELGLKYAFAIPALYCTSCGYIEFYASKNKLESLAHDRTAAAAKQQEKDMNHEEL